MAMDVFYGKDGGSARLWPAALVFLAALFFGRLASPRSILPRNRPLKSGRSGTHPSFRVRIFVRTGFPVFCSSRRSCFSFPDGRSAPRCCFPARLFPSLPSQACERLIRHLSTSLSGSPTLGVIIPGLVVSIALALLVKYLLLLFASDYIAARNGALPCRLHMSVRARVPPTTQTAPILQVPPILRTSHAMGVGGRTD